MKERKLFRLPREYGQAVPTRRDVQREIIRDARHWQNEWSVRFFGSGAPKHAKFKQRQEAIDYFINSRKLVQQFGGESILYRSSRRRGYAKCGGIAAFYDDQTALYITRSYRTNRTELSARQDSRIIGRKHGFVEHACRLKSGIKLKWRRRSRDLIGD